MGFFKLKSATFYVHSFHEPNKALIAVGRDISCGDEFRSVRIKPNDVTPGEKLIELHAGNSSLRNYAKE